MTYPKISINSNELQIYVCEKTVCFTEKDVEFVIDFNGYGDVVGLEILNLRLETGASFLNKIRDSFDRTTKSISYSYDKESDSFYLKLAEDASSAQRAVDGLLLLNSTGEIIGFSCFL
ncbi:MAG: hypothetical protein CSA81_12230 [Acidobacteria bacterium]|nr:MAG: hypothetical protein CSA81_12230 [Acidobacteriota bacterium]